MFEEQKQIMAQQEPISNLYTRKRSPTYLTCNFV